MSFKEKCTVSSCSNHRTKENKSKFFWFPGDSNMCKKWVAALNCPILNKTFQTYGAGHLHLACRICADHFDIKHFKNSNLQNVLNRDAVPSINLNNQYHNTSSIVYNGRNSEAITTLVNSTNNIFITLPQEQIDVECEFFPISDPNSEQLLSSTIYQNQAFNITQESLCTRNNKTEKADMCNPIGIENFDYNTTVIPVSVDNCDFVELSNPNSPKESLKDINLDPIVNINNELSKMSHKLLLNQMQVECSPLNQTCIVDGCKNFNYRNQKAFHRFPRNEKMCTAWVSAINSPKVNRIYKTKGHLRMSEIYRVCSDHFEDKYFRNLDLLSQGLWKFAIPTKNLDLVNETKDYYQTRNPKSERFAKSHADASVATMKIDKLNALHTKHIESVEKSCCTEISCKLRESKLKLRRAQKLLSKYRIRIKKQNEIIRELQNKIPVKNAVKMNHLIRSVKPISRIPLNLAKKHRFSKSLKSFALDLFKSSPLSYNNLQKIYFLPSPKTLKRWLVHPKNSSINVPNATIDETKMEDDGIELKIL